MRGGRPTGERPRRVGSRRNDIDDEIDDGEGEQRWL
jgi:hypothetical protein